MWQIPFLRPRRLATTAIPLILAASGCCHQCGRVHVDQCADIPPGAIPQPNGTYSCEWQQAHAARAEQDRYVIYEHEWYKGGQEFGPFGQRHVGRIAADLPTTSLNVIVESHYDAENNLANQELDEARRQVVVNALATRGVEDADQRVIIGHPRAEGLYGEEGVLIGERRLQVSGQGTGVGGTGGGIGGGSGIGIAVGGVGGGGIF